jgi:hypothetical protein
MRIEITEPLVVLPMGLVDISKWQHIPENLENIMTQLNELAATLITVDNQLTKAKGEILAKIDALIAALGDVALPAEAEAALTALAAQAQVLDDIVPDAPPTE